LKIKSNGLEGGDVQRTKPSDISSGKQFSLSWKQAKTRRKNVKKVLKS
jgi:hypothetical protein